MSPVCFADWDTHAAPAVYTDAPRDTSSQLLNCPLVKDPLAQGRVDHPPNSPRFHTPLAQPGRASYCRKSACQDAHSILWRTCDKPPQALHASGQIQAEASKWRNDDYTTPRAPCQPPESRLAHLFFTFRPNRRLRGNRRVSREIGSPKFVPLQAHQPPTTHIRNTADHSALRGRPGARNDDARPIRSAVRLTQASEPSGRPRLTLARIASNSF